MHGVSDAQLMAERQDVWARFHRDPLNPQPLGCL